MGSAWPGSPPPATQPVTRGRGQPVGSPPSPHSPQPYLLGGDILGNGGRLAGSGLLAALCLAAACHRHPPPRPLRAKRGDGHSYGGGPNLTAHPQEKGCGAQHSQEHCSEAQSSLPAPKRHRGAPGGWGKQRDPGRGGAVGPPHPSIHPSLPPQGLRAYRVKAPLGTQ